MSRISDVTIYGATGFTGALACAYLDRVILLAREQEAVKPHELQFQNQREFLHTVAGQQTKASIRWYLAGRDEKKLLEMKQKFTTCSGIFVADSGDQPAVDKMVASSRVLLSFAGPFQLYGSGVVAACVKHGTHYCDSTGEVPWVQQMDKQFGQQAQDNGTKIVPMCGFDCVPSDLGVLYAVTKLRELYPKSQGVRECKTYASTIGGLSGGTTYTFMLMENDPVSKDPFALSGGAESQEQLEHAAGNQREAKYDSELGQWTAPFMMEMLNTRVVRKSAKALGYRHGSKGGFLYSESALAKSEAVARKMAMPGPSLEVRKQLVAQGKLPSPGQGPDHALRRKSKFRLWIKAEGEAGERVWVSVSGGEMGYEDTSLMCVESALALALDFDSLPRGGGVQTPSQALGTVLVERLQLAGIRFKVSHQKPFGMAAL